MDNDQKETLIKEVQWESFHDERLKISARDDLEIIRSQVKQGAAQLWECTSANNHGYAVTRIDPGPELVVVLGEGSGFMEFAPRFVEFAKRKNMTIRTHVTRKGMIRFWSRLGLNVDEYILRG
jgi:hypothetical protein